MRKIIILTGAVILFGAIIFLGYYFGTKNNAPGTPTDDGGLNLPQAGNVQGTGVQAGNTVSGVGGASTVLKNKLLAYFVDENKTIFGVETTGTIIKATKDKVENLSTDEIKDIVSTSFSYDGKMVLVSSGANRSPRFGVFDVVQKEWIPLRNDIQAASWAPNSYNLALLIEKDGFLELSSADVQDKKFVTKNYIKLPLEEVDVLWATPAQILISEKPSVFVEGSSWMYNIKTGLLNMVLEEWNGSMSSWSKDLSRGLEFHANKNRRGGGLSLISENGRVEKGLNLLTLPTKCVFYDKKIEVPDTRATSTISSVATSTTSTATTSTATSTTKTATSTKASSTSTSTSSSTAKSATSTAATSTIKTIKEYVIENYLICGVPINESEFRMAALPDDYIQKSLFSTDNIYKIDLKTGDLAGIMIDPNIQVDAEKMSVYDDTLYFIDRFTNELYSLPL